MLIKERINKSSDWEKWFAWHPVCFRGGEYLVHAWLQFIERCTDESGCFSFRQIKK